MPESFSPKALEYRPEHERSAGWFTTLCQMLSQPKLDLTCHLQKDGSQIFKFSELRGREFTYYLRVWPNGNVQGGREVPNNE